ncbi:MAG: o-succinylbenzoate synthase [Muribaculaceae bacterium]|nr:o-succinylbenzoate synthase [Muribaculaceae bacterium]
MLQAVFKHHVLNFAFVANTSRESFTKKDTFIVEVFDSEYPHIKGVGEVAVFPSLQPSFRNMDEFIGELEFTANHINEIVAGNHWPKNSAIRFGFETALRSHAKNGSSYLYSSEQLKNIESGILINGLVWMNDIRTMEKQLNEKIESGFKCVKLKIGAHDFNKEVDLLRNIRNVYPAGQLEIRVDANGAFNRHDVLKKLDKLAVFDLHSIEQPLPRDCEFTEQLCKESPVPVALDEDMIERWLSVEEMIEYLRRISPSYIVVKPSLIGGFKMADKWIKAAESLGIGWWATSALESNIGLSAIAQWLSTHPDNLKMHHGLGTGSIYTNNLNAPIELVGERLFVKHDSI